MGFESKDRHCACVFVAVKIMIDLVNLVVVKHNLATSDDEQRNAVTCHSFEDVEITCLMVSSG